MKTLFGGSKQSSKSTSNSGYSALSPQLQAAFDPLGKASGEVFRHDAFVVPALCLDQSLDIGLTIEPSLFTEVIGMAGVVSAILFGRNRRIILSPIGIRIVGLDDDNFFDVSNNFGYLVSFRIHILIIVEVLS